MKMTALGGGLGVGVRDFRAYFVFLDSASMERFLEQGIDFGGEGNITATSGEEHEQNIDMNAAQNLDSLQADMAIFQLTDTGIVLQASLVGTLFRPDDELN